MKLYGKDWKKVEQHVGTRSSTQARSHAQKVFLKGDFEFSEDGPMSPMTTKSLLKFE